MSARVHAYVTMVGVEVGLILTKILISELNHVQNGARTSNLRYLPVIFYSKIPILCHWTKFKAFFRVKQRTDV